MNTVSGKPSAIRPFWSVIGESLGLFALFAVVYLALGANIGTLAMLALSLGYLAWTYVSSAGAADGSPISTFKVALFGLAQLISGVLAVAQLSMLLFGVWVLSAYDLPAVSENGVIGFLTSRDSTTLVIPLFLAVLFVLALLSFTLLRPAGVGYFQFISDLFSNDRKRLFRLVALWIVLGMAFAGLVNVAGAALTTNLVLTEMAPGRDVTAFEQATMFPVIPYSLAAACLLLALYRPMLSAEFARAAGKPAEAPAWRGLFAGAGSLAVLVGLVDFMVVGVIATLTVVPAIPAVAALPDSIGQWETAQRAEGMTTGEIAEKLNSMGRWSAGDPDNGLASLLPDYKDAMNLSGMNVNGCTVDVTAGVADPLQIEGVDSSSSDLKYCARISCTHPAKGRSDPSTSLVSSHGSQNLYWMKMLYIDVMARGRAFAPGGFCTDTGELAESYQG